MNKEEIKQECEELYTLIKQSCERLSELQEMCKHEDTFEGEYMWRLGSTYPATICVHCGKPIKNNKEE